MAHRTQEGQMEKTTDCFGQCSDCGRPPDGFMNVRRLHWMVCLDCRTRWCIGENLFSGWRIEDEEVWRRNKEFFGEYQEIKSLPALRDTGEGPISVRCLDPILWGEALCGLSTDPVRSAQVRQPPFVREGNWRLWREALREV